MLFKAPGKPSQLKKAIYLLASIILGLLVSVIVHAFIEINYIIWTLRQGHNVYFYGKCALHPLLQTAIWLSGAVGGFWWGKFWWQKIYIERAWRKKRLARR